jgi:hypothetical protein
MAIAASVHAIRKAWSILAFTARLYSPASLEASKQAHGVVNHALGDYTRSMLAEAQPTTMNVADFFLPLIPWIVFFIVFWFFALRIIRRQIRQIGQAMEQRRAIQEKLDRIIALLERRDGAA